MWFRNQIYYRSMRKTYVTQVLPTSEAICEHTCYCYLFKFKIYCVSPRQLRNKRLMFLKYTHVKNCSLYINILQQLEMIKRANSNVRKSVASLPLTCLSNNVECTILIVVFYFQTTQWRKHFHLKNTGFVCIFWITNVI